MKARSPSLSLSYVLATDLLSIVFTVIPVSLSVLAALWLLELVPWFALQVVLFPLVWPLAFIFVCFCFRICLPRLKQGVYKTGFNKGFFAWWAHSLLMRASRISCIHYVLHSLPIFRFLFWRAMGLKIPYRVSTSNRITIHDFQLLTIGEGCIFSEDTEISAHLIRGDKILLAPVKIGKNVFVGRDTYIGPRTRIGDGAWIGFGHHLVGEVIEGGAVKASAEIKGE